MRRTRGLVASFVIAVMALAACGGGSSGDDPPDDAAPERGGTVTYLFLAEPPDLAPETATFSVAVGTAERFAIYDALLVERPPTGELEMRLAKDLTSTDPRHWTLTLRPGLVFSDGTPLDAEAVKANWERAADPARKSPSYRLAANIETLEVDGAQGLDITLKVPDAVFDRGVAEAALNYIGSPTAMDSAGAGFGVAPVGAGAFTLDRWTRGSQMALRKNPRYQGSVDLDGVVVKYLPDETARFATLASGGGDLAYTPDPAVAARAEDARHEATTVALDGGFNLQFNVTKPPFDDRRARRAVALAVDPADLNDTVWQGKGEPIRSIFRSSSPFSSGIKQLATDRDAAQALFDELAAEGHPVSFTISSSPAQAAAAQWLQGALAAFDGVHVEVGATPPAQLLEVIRSGGFQLLMSKARWYDPALGLTNALVSNGFENFGHYANPAIDVAAARAAATSDIEERRAAYEEIERVVVDDVPLYFHSRLQNAIVVSTAVKGMAVVSDGIPVWTELSKG